jgi:threonine dehydrogenase-like Zn-dependent dehydrogenase
MRANVWSGRNTVQVENVPDPQILNSRDAIVRITSTAICGSDLHLYDAYDRAKQAARLETDRPYVLRDAIMACRNGGIVSVVGVYGGFIDKFPAGAWMNRGLTLKTGQCHVQRYMKPLLERVRNGEIDPSFVVTHRLELGDAPRGYETFKNKQDDCVKVVLRPQMAA